MEKISDKEIYDAASRASKRLEKCDIFEIFQDAVRWREFEEYRKSLPHIAEIVKCGLMNAQKKELIKQYLQESVKGIIFGNPTQITYDFDPPQQKLEVVGSGQFGGLLQGKIAICSHVEGLGNQDGYWCERCNEWIYRPTFIQRVGRSQRFNCNIDKPNISNTPKSCEHYPEFGELLNKKGYTCRYCGEWINIPNE